VVKSPFSYGFPMVYQHFPMEIHHFNGAFPIHFSTRSQHGRQRAQVGHQEIEVLTHLAAVFRRLRWRTGMKNSQKKRWKSPWVFQGVIYFDSCLSWTFRLCDFFLFIGGYNFALQWVAGCSRNLIGLIYKWMFPA